MAKSPICHGPNISMITSARKGKDQGFSILNPEWEKWAFFIKIHDRLIEEKRWRNPWFVTGSTILRRPVPQKGKGSKFLNSEPKMRNLILFRFRADSSKWNDGPIPDSSQAQHFCQHQCPKEKESKFLNFECKMRNLIVFRIHNRLTNSSLTFLRAPVPERERTKVSQFWLKMRDLNFFWRSLTDSSKWNDDPIPDSS